MFCVRGQVNKGADASTKAGRLFARFWRDYVSRYRGDLALLAPALVLVAAAGTAYGFVMKWIAESFERGGSGIVIFGPIAIVAVTCLRGFAIWSQAILSQGLGLKVLRDLQGAMFGKITFADFERVGRE